MARSLVTRASIRKAGNWSVEGLDQVYDNLDRILDRTSAENLKGVFMTAGKVVRDRAINAAPYNPKRKRGYHLKQAIFAAPGKSDQPNVLVGVSRSRKSGHPSAPHGILLEYGTSKMAARPFFRNAVKASKSDVSQIIADGIKAAVDGAVR